MNILNKIIHHKENEINHLKLNYTTSQLESSLFFDRETISLKSKLKSSSSGIIAEHKRKSPSRDIINNKLKIQEVISGYQDAGVCGISVLTDVDFFGGTNDDLKIAREIFEGPILRKDFMIDPYQIYETKASGGDCILLIVAALDLAQLNDFSQLAEELNLDVLIEVHSEDELNIALSVDPRLVGINNRDLTSFEVDKNLAKELAKQISNDVIVVSESGISSKEDILSSKEQGIHAFLVGESFMRKPSPGEALREILV